MKLHKSTFLLLTLALTGCANYFEGSQANSMKTETRSSNKIWQEHRITSEVAALSNNPEYRGTVRVNASVLNSRVILMGQAANEELHQQVVEQVKQIAGNNKVFDQMKIKAPLSVKEVSYDSWLTTKVKTALFSEQSLKGISIKVITEDREVFLTGAISKKNADMATYTARNVVGVKKVVRAFDYID